MLKRPANRAAPASASAATSRSASCSAAGFWGHRPRQRAAVTASAEARRRAPAIARVVLIVGVTLMGVPLFTGAGAPEAPAVADAAAAGPTEGEALFRRTCAACHGPNARGLPGLGKDLVRSTFARRLTDAQLIAFITRGRPANDPANTTGVPMPPKGGNPSLTRRDIADIVAYIRTLQRR